MRQHTGPRAATRPRWATTRPSRTRPTRRGLAPALLLIAGLVLAGCGTDIDQSALHPAGPYAQGPHDLIVVVAIIALVVFVLVQGLIVASIIRFRVRKDDDGSLPVQVHGNTRLEIFWTVIPALILAVIAVPTVQMIFTTMDEPDEEFLEVQVFGHRWWFEYYYPDYDIYTANELVIPAGMPVRLEMTAVDPAREPDQGVIHSFWIPRLGGKQDVVPGHLTHLNLQADEPGRFLGQCAEYCGLSHVNMRARAIALDEGDFATWVEEQQAPAEVPQDGLEAQGHELFQNACATCHDVWEGEGVRAPSFGPDLTHLQSRDEFAGAIHDLTEDNLRAWLRDPNAMKPMQYEQNRIGMPDLGLDEDQIDALVAYLMTLE